MNGGSFLIEGRPGAGKTTVVRGLVNLLTAERVPMRGFFTEEIRERGTRVGFVVEDFIGNRAVLAHTSIRSGVRVGKYHVDLDAFERIAIPALANPAPEDTIIIDELGKMELGSEQFRERTEALFNTPNSIVATVHVFRHPFTDALKKRPDVEVLRVTQENRDALPRHLLALMKA